MSEKIRLQKFIARAAIASRREAERLILEGRVKVNGKVVRQLGVQIDPEVDTVEVDGSPVMLETEFVYVLLNKPRYCLTTRHDPKKRKTVYDFLKGLPKHLAHAGRLDWDSEGAIIFTNDGDFVNMLIHPKHKLPKTYEVKVKGVPTQKALDTLTKGVKLKEGVVRAQLAEIVRLTEHGNAWVKIVLTEGKKNQIKRMMQAIGYRVMRLVRTHIGSVSIEGLEPGQWRFLTDKEVERLKRESGGLSRKSRANR